MAALILPRRFYSQPQGPVEFDPSIIHRPPLVHVSPIQPGTIARAIAAYPNGRAYKFDEAGAQYNDLAFSGTTFPDGYTFISVIAPTGTDSSYSNLFNVGRAGLLRRFQLRHDTTTWYLYQNSNSTGQDWSAVTWGYSANAPTVVVGRWDGATVYAYEQGVLRGSIAKGAGAALLDIIRIGGDAEPNNAVVAGTYWEGGIGNFTLLDYDIGENVAIELSRNPWQLFRAQPRVLYFDVAGGGSTRTATASLAAAVQAARTATASLSAAILRPNAATAGLSASIQQALVTTAGLDSAIQQARSAAASLDALIEAAGAKTATASLNAAVQQPRTAAAGMDAAIRQAFAAGAALDAAIRQTGSATASLSAAVQRAQAATAGMDAAIRQQRTLQAALDAFIEAPGSASASLDAAIQAPRTATTSLSAAVQRAQAAVAGLDAAIAARYTASAGLDGYINAGNTIAATLDAAIVAARVVSATMNAFIAADGNPAIDNRLYTVPRENRLYTVPRENRLYTVPRENRLYTLKE